MFGVGCSVFGTRGPELFSVTPTTDHRTPTTSPPFPSTPTMRLPLQIMRTKNEKKRRNPPSPRHPSTYGAQERSSPRPSSSDATAGTPPSRRQARRHLCRRKGGQDARHACQQDAGVPHSSSAIPLRGSDKADSSSRRPRRLTPLPPYNDTTPANHAYEEPEKARETVIPSSFLDLRRGRRSPPPLRHNSV